MNQSIKDLADAYAEEADFTKESAGGDFERDLPEEGIGVCRLREYVEVGKHSTASKRFPKKKPARLARFVFELCTPKHIKEIEVEGEKKRFGYILSTNFMPVSNSGNSNYMKLFKQLNWQGEAKVPPQLLSKPFMVEIIHGYHKDDMENGKPKKGAKPRYANFMRDKTFTFRPPRKEDPIAGTSEDIPVPEILGDLKLFLWDRPNKECWDSIFIDGTRTVKKDGEEVEESKNWIQDKCLAALDYQGSKLQELLEGGGETLDDLSTDEPEEPSQNEGKELEDMLGV